MPDGQIGDQSLKNGNVIVSGSNADIISCGQGPVQLSIGTVREKLEQNKGMKPEDVVLLEDKGGTAYFVTISELTAADSRQTAAEHEAAAQKKPAAHAAHHGNHGGHAHAGTAHAHASGDAHIGAVATTHADHAQPSRLSSFLGGLQQTYIGADGNAFTMTPAAHAEAMKKQEMVATVATPKSTGTRVASVPTPGGSRST